MKPGILRSLECGLAALTLSSCDVIFDSIIDSAFESKRDRNIREDSRNLDQGKPLEHYKTERRLKIDREDRLFEELQD